MLCYTPLADIPVGKISIEEGPRMTSADFKNRDKGKTNY